MTDENVINADTATELLEALVEGYSSIDPANEAAALALRYDFAAEQAKDIQAVLAAQAEGEGTFPPDGLDESTLDRAVRGEDQAVLLRG